MDDLIGEFIDETTESLARLDAPLDRLKTHSNDPDAWQQIYDVAHMIKGTCGFAALPRLELLAGTLEQNIETWQEKTALLSAEQLAIIFQVITLIKEQVAYIELHAQEQAGEDTAMIAKLNAINTQLAKDATAELPSKTRMAVNDNSTPSPKAKSNKTAAKTAPAEFLSAPAAPVSISQSLMEEAWLEDLKNNVQDLTALQKALLTDQQAGAQAQRELLEQAADLGAAIQHNILELCPASRKDMVGLVKRRDQIWIIAQHHIVQFIPLQAQANTANDSPVITLEEQDYPLVDLVELMNQAISPPSQTAQQDGQYAVLCQVKNQHFGIIVDEVLDVMPLPAKVSAPPPDAGAYILGKCHVDESLDALVLNMHGIASSLSPDPINQDAAREENETSDEHGLLLFSIGENTQQAVMMDAVDSVITVDVADIEIANDGPAILHNHRLIRLTSLPDSAPLPEEGQINVILLSHSNELVGLAVAAIKDIIYHPLTLNSDAADLHLSQVVIDGIKTDIMNAQQVIASDLLAMDS